MLTLVQGSKDNHGIVGNISVKGDTEPALLTLDFDIGIA